VSDAARRRAFDSLLPALTRADPKSVAEDLKVILEAFKRDDPIRFQASALLAGLSLVRPDSEDVLMPAIPSLLEQLERENSQRVRENIVRTLMNLRPNIPDVTLEPLIRMRSDAHEPTARSAVLALVRMGRGSPLALEAVKKSMTDDRLQIRLAIVDAIGYYNLADEGTLSILCLGLQDGSSRIVLGAIRSIGQIGSHAFKNDLQEIIKTHTDVQVVAAAKSAISRMN
jgi:HEAT repeat protein